MTTRYSRIKSFLICSLFFIPLIPSYIGIKPAGSALINTQRIICLAALVFFLAINLTKRFKINVPGKGNLNSVFLLISAYILIRIVSIAASPTKIYSAFIVAIELTTIYFIFFFSLGIFENKKIDPRKILRYFAVPFSIILISVFLEQATESNLFKLLAPEGLIETGYISSALEQKVREGSYRAQGPFLHPLVLSQYINFTFPLIALGISIRLKRGAICVAAILSLTTLSSLGIIATGSRSGIIILAVQISMAFLIFAVRDKSSIIRNAKIIASAPVILTSLYLAASSDTFKEKIEGSNKSELMSTEARIIQYTRGITALAESPFLGLGPGNAIDHAYTHNITTGEKSIDSYYLNIMVDSGYISLTLYLCASIFFAIFLAKNSITLEWGRARYYIAALCSFTAILATSITLSSYELFTYSSISLAALLGSIHNESGNITNGP